MTRHLRPAIYALSALLIAVTALVSARAWEAILKALPLSLLWCMQWAAFSFAALCIAFFYSAHVWQDWVKVFPPSGVQWRKLWPRIGWTAFAAWFVLSCILASGYILRAGG